MASFLGGRSVCKTEYEVSNPTGLQDCTQFVTLLVAYVVYAMAVSFVTSQEFIKTAKHIIMQTVLHYSLRNLFALSGGTKSMWGWKK